MKIDLFTGTLIDGRPCTIWADEALVHIRIGEVTISTPKDAWFDVVNAVMFSARKKDALEEGNLVELEELAKDVKEREEMLRGEGGCDCH